MSPFFVLLVVALLVHVLLVQYVLAGSAYLACGRFMGPRRCAVCGWQAILLFWLPVATGLAIVTGLPPLALLWLQRGEPFITMVTLSQERWLPIVPVLVGCLGLLLLQKSAWITRRSWFWRIPVAAAAFAGFAFVAARWTESHLLALGEDSGPAAVLPRLGVTFFSSFSTLAVALAWQGRLLGMRLDQPPALAEVVVGLSPVRRLAMTALSGAAGVAIMTMLFSASLPLAASRSDGDGGPLAASLVGGWAIAAGLGLMTQAACWITAVVRDRLTTRLLAVATAACLVSVASGVALRETARLGNVAPTAVGTTP